MALKVKESFISQSRDGRRITVQDSTGLQSTSNPDGYGGSNLTPQSILAYYFQVSKIYSGIDYVLKVDGSEELLPTPLQIAYGNTISLTTDLLSGGSIEGPTDIFWDGVLDMNMYVAFAGLTGVTITENTNYITGGDFTEALKGDAVVVNEVIYEIDKDFEYGTNGNTVLYIIGNFEDTATSFNTLYRANTKALLISMSENLHDYACKKLSRYLESKEWHKVNTAASFRRAAIGFFNKDVPDYAQANSLVSSNYELLKRYVI